MGAEGRDLTDEQALRMFRGDFRMSAVAVARKAEWLGRAAEVICPPELATTDRVCQRWAVSIGMGMPTEKWRDEPGSRPPPLDDDIAIVVDQIILRCPEKTKRLVRGWYCTTVAQPALAEQFNLTERTLVAAWLLSLNFLQFRFVESKHKGLLVLLKLRD